MWVDKGSQKYYGKPSLFTLSGSEETRIDDSIQWLWLFAVIRLALISWCLDGKTVVCRNVWEVDPLHHRPVLFAASSPCTKRCSIWKKFSEISVHIWKSNQGTNAMCVCAYSYIYTCVSSRITDCQSRKLSLFQMTPLLRVFSFSIPRALSYT